jgi:outer membrane protein OmpA-like peptidoglycan-associated protein
MYRLSTFLPVVLTAALGACASMRQPGALSPIGARVTNEVIADDARTIDGWSLRIDALQRAGDAPSPERTYATARAAAWLGYARDAYAADPRDGVADAALAETRRLVTALEHGTVPTLGTAAAPAATTVRPDLWATLEQAQAGSARTTAPVALADAEVALVRAARLVNDVSGDRALASALREVERACALQAQLATAERLLGGLQIAAPIAPPVAVIALQGMPVALPPRLAPLPAPIARRRGVERVVHFAVGSSELSMQSRVTLGEVIALLRAHPKVNLVIAGFTDNRGDEQRNRDLAARRAEAVRKFLDTATLDLGRVTMEGIGTDSTAARHATIDAFARDRRVMLSFTGTDGQPLTVAEYQSLDVNHESDLQLEQARRPARASLRPSRGATRSSAAPR